MRFVLPDDMFITAESVPDGPMVFGAALYGGELVVACSAPLGRAAYLHTPAQALAKVTLRVAAPVGVRFVDESPESVRNASANSKPLQIFPSQI
jgi:hypothetical protein